MWRTLRRPFRVVPAALNEFIQANASAEKAPDAALHHSVTLAAADTNTNSIYENLAAEEALIRGITLHPDQCLLLYYINTPCVVVGRNQNIFQEVALRRAARDGVRVARRASGGGAVFHDTHNLCFSFLTHRTRYAPEKTIQLLRLGLSTLYHIDPARITTTGRHDLFLDGRKITGSAMRVQRDIAYHHCTLLVDTPHELLGRYLHPEGDYVDFRTSSVGSVRSPVTTLTEAGCVPATPDAMERVKAGMTDFFLSQGKNVLSAAAPWDLDVATLRCELDAERATVADAPLYSLDVRRAVAEDMPLTEGEGRRYARGDAHTLAEAVRTAQTPDWVHAMPPFTSVVQITRRELHESLTSCSSWPDVVRESTLSSEELVEEVLELLLPSGEEETASGSLNALRLHTTMEQRKITRIAFTRAKEVAGAPAGKASEAAEETPVEWLSRFFSTLLVDSVSDAPVKGVEADQEDKAGIVIRGFLHEAGAAAPDLPDVALEAATLLSVKALLTLWREKNVFDVR